MKRPIENLGSAMATGVGDCEEMTLWLWVTLREK